MQVDIGKDICESLLKDGLISENTVESQDRMDLIIDDLLECFPNYTIGDQRSKNSLKKKIGKMLSIKARVLNVDQQALKKVKILVYNKINQIVGNQKKRVLKLRKKRQVYSSDEQQSELKQEQDEIKEQQNEIEETGSASGYEKKKNNTFRKRKYQTYDYDFKEQVCQMALQKSVEQAIQYYNLSSRKINSWLQSHNLNLLGKGRKALDPAMEFNMCVWILRKIWDQVPLTQKIIRQKAATMKTINISFNGSKGWLQKFFLRHVQVKSCFDTRGKPQLRQQCARYHKSAFERLIKDYENLLKMQIGRKSLVNGNLASIIYEKGTDPVLKLSQDKNIDKFTLEDDIFYDYQKFKLIPVMNNQNLGKIEEQNSQQIHQKEQESEDQAEYESSDSELAPKLEDSVEYKNEQSEQDEKQLDIYEEEESDETIKIQEKA